MTTRRSFFGSLLGLAAIPFIGFTTKEPVVNWSWSVEKYLTAKWNEHAKGRGAAACPRNIYVSRWLLEKYEASLKVHKRFVKSNDDSYQPQLVFKMARMQAVDWLDGWEVRMV